MFGRIVSWFAKRAIAAENAIDHERREKLRAERFPDHFVPYVGEIVQTRGLTAEQRAKLYRDIQVFLGEKKFVALEEFPLDDRVRVIVATSAAILVLGRDISQFDHVREIHIRHELAPNVGGLYQPVHTMLGDEVIERYGIVELGWKAVSDGLVRAEGQHVVFHELAHAYDDADGEVDALVKHEHFERWSARLRNLELHSERRGSMLFIERVGNTEGPELFASASELFFECPRRLHKLDAALFDALVEIYALDPRTLTER